MDSSDDDYDQGKIERMQLARSLQFKVGTLCRQEEDQEHRNEGGSAQNKNIRMSQSAIAALTELTYHYATKCLGPDLIKFSQHGNRKTINVDDVKLAARRNPKGVLDSLQNFCEKNQDQFDTGVGNKHRSKKRSRTTANTSSRSNSMLHENSSKNNQYDIGDSDDEKSESDASLGVGPSSKNIGRTETHDIQFDLQIHSSSSSSSSDTGSNDGDDDDPMPSKDLSNGEYTPSLKGHQTTSYSKNGMSVLDDSDSDLEIRMKRNSANSSSSTAGPSKRKNNEHIELLDSD